MKREHQTPNGFFTSIQVFTHFNGTVREERMCARVRENVRELEGDTDTRRHFRHDTSPASKVRFFKSPVYSDFMH